VHHAILAQPSGWRLELVDRVAAGTREVVVAQTYPLAEAAVTHRELMTGHVRGKIALVP
jgi:NADPH:quinone reductase-like Zn-dependent oxidoreductase